MFLAGYVFLFGVYLVLLAPSLNGSLLVVLLTLLGAFYASTDGVLIAMTSVAVSRARRSSGIAVLTTAAALSGFAASLTFGAMWSWWGPTTTVKLFAGAARDRDRDRGGNAACADAGVRMSQKPTRARAGAGPKIALFTALILSCAVVGIGYVLHARSQAPTAGHSRQASVAATDVSLTKLLAHPYLVARTLISVPPTGRLS